MSKNFVPVDIDMILVSIYNSCNADNKICINDADFFEDAFESPFDAAWAVSLSGRWTWSDDFVCFDAEGHLTSFSHWDDENSPIDLDELDISQLIQSLKKCKKDRYVVNNIPRAIHDALDVHCPLLEEEEDEEEERWQDLFDGYFCQ